MAFKVLVEDIANSTPAAKQNSGPIINWIVFVVRNVMSAPSMWSDAAGLTSWLDCIS